MSMRLTPIFFKVTFVLFIYLFIAPLAFASEASIFSFKICSELKFDASLHDRLLALENKSTGKLSQQELVTYKNILETAGWPTYQSAGVDGIDAAAKLLFRSAADPKFQINVIRDLDPQVGVDIEPKLYAKLSDAVNLMKSGEQTYGTILFIDAHGRVKPRGHLVNNDARLFFRDFYGLPTLKEEVSKYRPAVKRGFDGSDWNGTLGRKPPIYTHPEIRKELGEMISNDQSARIEAIRATGDRRTQLIARMKSVDLKNLTNVKKIFDQVGFPTVSMVGRDGVSTAFLLVQHADSDPKFQERALDLAGPLMEKRELSRRQYAYLIDRVRLAKGERQLYGTQVSVISGKAVPLPLEDPDSLDLRRAEMFMGSEKVYLHEVESGLH